MDGRTATFCKTAVWREGRAMSAITVDRLELRIPTDDGGDDDNDGAMLY